MSKGHYDEDLISAVRSRADIVSVVSEYVNLRKAGKNYVGLCPFHQEKTPSFTVDPDKQLFYCFGCGVGGNVFTFLMKKENMTFPEALETLARKGGVPLPAQKTRGITEKEKREREAIFEALEMAQASFREMLFSRHGVPALEYLKGRGLSRETLDMFGLGFAPSDWEFIVARGKKSGLEMEYFHKAGLIIPRENGGGYYDRFRGRVTFPIWDSAGRLIGFAGRSLGEETPKYLNSPDTPVFRKGRELYALNLAKAGIRGSGKVLIMEGYMDVISAFQNGVDYAVAGMGTALSKEQARTLLLLSQEVVLSYDQDEAGKRAAQRSIEVFRSVGGRTRVLTFGGAKDPDEFFRLFGKDKFLQRVEEAVPDIMFIYQEARSVVDISRVEGKLRVKDLLVPILASLESEFEISAYTEEISRDLGVKKESLDKDVELYKRKAKPEIKYKKSENSNTTGYGNQLKPGGKEEKQVARIDLFRRKAEEGIIRSLVEKPELLQLAEAELEEKDFADTQCRMVFSSLKKNPRRWLSDESVSGWIAELCVRFGPVAEPLRVLKDCVRKLKEFRLKELEEEIREAQREKDNEKLSRIAENYQALLKEVKSTGGYARGDTLDDFPRRELG